MNDPENLLKQWMRAVNTGDLEGLLAMYDDNAVLIPTFSNRLLNKSGSVRDYFEKLCAREELSIALHERTLGIQSLGGKIHAMHGIYCWRFEIEGELLSFEARFSYMVDLAREKPILHHHSSQIPRML